MSRHPDDHAERLEELLADAGWVRALAGGERDEGAHLLEAVLEAAGLLDPGAAVASHVNKSATLRYKIFLRIQHFFGYVFRVRTGHYTIIGL